MFNIIHKFFHGDLPKDRTYFKILNDNEYEYFKDYKIVLTCVTGNGYVFANPNIWNFCKKIEFRDGWLQIVDDKNEQYSLQCEIISEFEYQKLQSEYQRMIQERELNEKISTILSYKNEEHRAEKTFDEFFNKTFDSVKILLESIVENDNEIFVVTSKINYDPSNDSFIVDDVGENFWDYQLRVYINNLYEKIKHQENVDYVLIDKIRDLIKEKE